MQSMDAARLVEAFGKARFELLAQRQPGGYWTGQLATSALATATAVSALALVKRRLPSEPSDASASWPDDGALHRLIVDGIEWLADHQNADGGWGDTDKSHSNIATTMLAVAAFHLTGVPAEHADLLTRGEAYVARAGGLRGLRQRYGKDKTFAVPILTNAALAGLVPWKHVSPLPFELACFPQKMYRFLRLPVVSYAIPALVAIGQARFHHCRPWNPLARLLRLFCRERSLEVLRAMQPQSGGYLEAIPLTSFVVMSLASIGQVEHEVTRRGVQFLVDTVREDGSWPIDTNLATWNTTLALNGLAGAGEEVSELASLDWLLSCQHRERHPFTGAEPGGWGWSDLSGAVPDADDTPSALLALASWRRSASCGGRDAARIDFAAEMGLRWLLDLQNRDGGWPTFCRGWGKLPFDRSGADLTAHAVRALLAWRRKGNVPLGELDAAAERGFAYLERVQREDGSWVPLWFGNQDHPQEENPVYGTARVLLAYSAAGRSDAPAAQRGFNWLAQTQRGDGGWSSADRTQQIASTVEETAVAVEALCGAGAAFEFARQRGVAWLVEAVETGRFREAAPIGFYFAKLWYHESLYPIIFTVAALGRALRHQPAASRPQPTSASVACLTD